jgi:hypothetical protein
MTTRLRGGIVVAEPHDPNRQPQCRIWIARPDPARWQHPLSRAQREGDQRSGAGPVGKQSAARDV